MTLLSFLLILFPAIVAAVYQFILIRRTSSALQFLVVTMAYCLAICFCMAGVGVLRGHGENSFFTFFESMKNIVKYTILSMSFALLFPNVVSLLLHTKIGKSAMKCLLSFTIQR